MSIPDTRNLTCDDPECPGCMMKDVIKKINDQGLDIDDIVSLFFLELSEIFQYIECEFREGKLTIVDRDTVH